MTPDLISRDALINAKPEFMNEKVVRDTKYRTSKDRIYARAWNACNSYWLNTIKNAPTVEAYTLYQVKDLVELNKKLAEERPQGKWIGSASASWECSCCGYGVNPWNNTPFCPNCGADMKGGAE